MTRSQTAFTLAALAVLAGLGGCSTRTNVAASGNTPPLYTHVYVTAQAVWFNQSATAGPADGGWVQFPLTTPVTVDLVANNGANFANVFTDLKLAPGSYSQVRFIPVDASLSLTASAQTLGASHNMEVDYVDGSGNTQQLALELLNPDQGLGIQASPSLTVPIGNVGAALSEQNNTTTTSPFGTGTTGTTSTTTAATTTGTGTNTTAEFALIFDAARDVTAFSYGGTNTTAGTPGVLLSSHVTAYDLSQSGGIQGQLTLTNLTGLTSANGTPGITASAESLTADGSRHFVVASTPVASDGTFTLYPLAANSSNNTSYDIVIHGAGIATIIIKNIIVPPVGSGVSTTGGTTSTSTTASTVVSSNPDTSPITPNNLVSVGTIIPRAASAYTANITTGSGAPLPAGAAVAFYETLSGSGSVPYVIEAAPIDPFNQVLANPQTLSAGTVDSGTYVTSGSTITVVSAAPAEGPAGTYQVAATAPLYADGALGTLVSAPAPSTSSTTGTAPPAATPPTVGPLTLASGLTGSTVSASVKPASASEYDQGEIMLSQNGQLIASAPINVALQAGGGTVQLTGVPGGASTSVYYVTVRAWNTSTGKLTRQWFSTPVDLRGGSTASVQLDLN